MPTREPAEVDVTWGALFERATAHDVSEAAVTEALVAHRREQRGGDD